MVVIARKVRGVEDRSVEVEWRGRDQGEHGCFPQFLAPFLPYSPHPRVSSRLLPTASAAGPLIGAPIFCSPWTRTAAIWDA